MSNYSENSIVRSAYSLTKMLEPKLRECQEFRGLEDLTCESKGIVHGYESFVSTVHNLAKVKGVSSMCYFVPTETDDLSKLRSNGSDVTEFVDVVSNVDRKLPLGVWSTVGEDPITFNIEKEPVAKASLYSGTILNDVFAVLTEVEKPWAVSEPGVITLKGLNRSESSVRLVGRLLTIYKHPATSLYMCSSVLIILDPNEQYMLWSDAAYVEISEQEQFKDIIERLRLEGRQAQERNSGEVGEMDKVEPEEEDPSDSLE